MGMTSYGRRPWVWLETAVIAGFSTRIPGPGRWPAAGSCPAHGAMLIVVGRDVRKRLRGNLVVRFRDRIEPAGLDVDPLVAPHVRLRVYPAQERRSGRRGGRRQRRIVTDEARVVFRLDLTIEQPTSAASSAQETATRSRFIKSLEQGKECRRTMENAQSRASRSEYRQKLQNGNRLPTLYSELLRNSRRANTFHFRTVMSAQENPAPEY